MPAQEEPLQTLQLEALAMCTFSMTIRESTGQLEDFNLNVPSFHHSEQSPFRANNRQGASQKQRSHQAGYTSAQRGCTRDGLAAKSDEKESDGSCSPSPGREKEHATSLCLGAVHSSS